jgi:hypothetical protein
MELARSLLDDGVGSYLAGATLSQHSPTLTSIAGTYALFALLLEGRLSYERAATSEPRANPGY